MLLTTPAGGGFCSELPSVHFISVGIDTRLHYIIRCNSKPRSIRAARFKWDAQPERRVGLTLCRSALLRAHSARHPKSAAKSVFAIAFGRASGTLPSWQP